VSDTLKVSDTVWTDPKWLAEAREWIDAQGVELTGPVEQPHVRPWSTALRLPTTDGVLWFKANHPSLAHEAAVVSIISRRRPDLVPELVAADLASGWMLMRDGGERLREVIERERDLSRWLELLPHYAELQIELAEDADALVAAGAPNRRLAVLPERVGPLELSGGQSARIEEWCERLAGYGIPETIQHDDFHDGQIFVQGERYLFFDWGDACVSHPFFTLAVTLEGVLRWGLDDIEDSVDIAPFRDAYLEPFERYATRDALVEATGIAYRLGWISRALCNHELDVALGVHDTPDAREDVRRRLELAFSRSP
jgi:Phosphotransferase enzyme family